MYRWEPLHASLRSTPHRAAQGCSPRPTLQYTDSSRGPVSICTQVGELRRITSHAYYDRVPRPSEQAHTGFLLLDALPGFGHTRDIRSPEEDSSVGADRDWRVSLPTGTAMPRGLDRSAGSRCRLPCPANSIPENAERVERTFGGRDAASDFPLCARRSSGHEGEGVSTQSHRCRPCRQCACPVRASRGES
jgi:hypothetical protein